METLALMNSRCADASHCKLYLTGTCRVFSEMSDVLRPLAFAETKGIHNSISNPKYMLQTEYPIPPS
jgi:hypothetical protein